MLGLLNSDPYVSNPYLQSPAPSVPYMQPQQPQPQLGTVGGMSYNPWNFGMNQGVSTGLYGAGIPSAQQSPFTQGSTMGPAAGMGGLQAPTLGTAGGMQALTLGNAGGLASGLPPPTLSTTGGMQAPAVPGPLANQGNPTMQIGKNSTPFSPFDVAGANTVVPYTEWNTGGGQAGYQGLGQNSLAQTWG